METSSFYTSIKKHDQMMYVPEIWCKTNGQTGRQTDKSDT